MLPLLQHQMTLKLLPAGVKEAAALREMFHRMEPFRPLLQFMADAEQNNTKLVGQSLELPGTGIAIPLRDARRLIDLMDQVGRDVLVKS
jgi:hypothetical protein